MLSHSYMDHILKKQLVEVGGNPEVSDSYAW